MNGVQSKLTLLNKQKFARSDAENLAAKLAANRASCACYHHHLIAHVNSKKNVVGRYGVTAKQVIDIQLPQISDTDFPLGQIAHAGQRTNGYMSGAHLAEDLVPPLTA